MSEWIDVLTILPRDNEMVLYVAYEQVNVGRFKAEADIFQDWETVDHDGMYDVIELRRVSKWMSFPNLPSEA